MALEQGLLRLMGLVEKAGLWLSVVAWLSVAGGALLMAHALRFEQRRNVWTAACCVGALALLANVADYRVTIWRSPDLALEANPLWRNVVDRWGIDAARAYGLSGKILLSLLAAQMYAFYLANRERLYPRRDATVVHFLRAMGERSATPGQRVAALFTLFSFFFAGIQLLGFYFAWMNALDDPIGSGLPPVPVAIAAFFGLLALAFVVQTYRSFAASQGRRRIPSPHDAAEASRVGRTVRRPSSRQR